MPASTDARFFRARGSTAYGVGLFDDRVSFPDFLSMFHGNDERVSIESVGLTVTLLDRVLHHWRDV
jgi:acetylornithine deacetylase/succinyl-diaminopimelate desuccinylase-like protein